MKTLQLHVSMSRYCFSISKTLQESDCLLLMFSVIQTGETINDSCITPEFNTNQCIFYPVKEEERELLLGATQTSRGSLTPEGSSVQTELQSADPALCE